MTAFANWAESAIVQHIVAEATWGAVAGTYVQLHNGDPGEDGTANVIASVGGRKSAAWAAEAGGTAATSADLEWTNGTGGSISVSHISIFDAITAGNAIYIGPLSATKVVPDTEVFRLPTGQLTIGAT